MYTNNFSWWLHHFGSGFFLESSVVLEEGNSSLTSIEASLSELEFTDTIANKKRVIHSLQDWDRGCEVTLDLIHSVQQRTSNLSPELVREVEELLNRHSDLSAIVEVCSEEFHLC